MRVASHFPVIIVGGGISGLSAAWELQKAGVRYALLESTGHWGGKIDTELVEGYGGAPFVIESGPDSVLTQKPWALQLALELGLGDRLLGTNDHQRKTYVLHRGRLTPLPDGVALIVPTRFWPFMTSPLLSWRGKLRMMGEWLLPARADDDDESMADFVRRRLGAEALDKLAEPLLAGIYNTEAEQQSLLATFPRFRDLEKQHGSLIRGMRAAQKGRAAQTMGLSPLSKPLSMFVSFKTGMHELVEGLFSHLTGDLRLNSAVQSITCKKALLQSSQSAGRGMMHHAPTKHHHTHGIYTLSLSDNSQLLTDNLILTTPAYITARLLSEIAPEASAMLADIRCVSSGTMALAYRRDDVPHPLDGFGVVIPRSEGRPINAITWTSTKFDYRAPEGCALLRIFFGGSRTPQSFNLNDDDLLRTVRGELHTILGIEAVPLFTRINRWPQANPQYDVGHLERIDALEAALPAGVYVTGSAYRGIGVPDCVHQAQITAAKVAKHLRET